MSEGPIKQWWRSHEPTKVSTPNSSRVCYQAPGASRAYCGRQLRASTTNVRGGNCSDCAAALRADGILPADSSIPTARRRGD